VRALFVAIGLVVGVCAILAAQVAAQTPLVVSPSGVPNGIYGRYSDIDQIDQDTSPTDRFVFARLLYNGQIPGYIKNWFTDWPEGDEHLITGLDRLSNLRLEEDARVVPVNDPALFEYPFVYTSEPGQMVLSNTDALIMREYLRRGGFWFLDDFWGSFEWAHFLTEIEKVLPGAEIRDIPMDHPLFHTFYDITEIVQVPSLNYVYNGGIVIEQDGVKAYCKGIWDDKGRLMVVINHNTDLGDAYEHADDPRYPHEFSGFAYRIATNIIIYALTH
jgi:hypothetical protein